MSLLDFPYFRCNQFLRFLLTCLYGGVHWLDKPYQVDVDTMNLVLGLPIEGEDSSKEIMTKDVVQEEVYTKYGTCRGSGGVVIVEINDHWVGFTMHLLAYKM
jgi:hypothetical protein